MHTQQISKLAILVLVALGMALCACGNGPNTNTVNNTTTNGNWEAKLIGGTGQASLLNFVTTFSVTNSGPLDITGFGFINDGACFATGLNAQHENGTASFTTDNSGKVTGTLSLTVTSINPPGNTLSLTGNLTGTSNGTTTKTGTLSNGVVVGDWTLSGGAGDPSCTGSGSFIMCQGNSTCTAP